MTKRVTKNYLLLILAGIGILFFSSSCVDTDVENIPTSFPDLKSQVRFVNNVGLDAAVAVENTQVATVSPEDSSSYMEFLAGRKTVTASFSTGPTVEEEVSFDTDYKITVSIIEDTTTGERFFQKTLDGYVWE
jgi:hypothetical protein